MDFFLWTEQSKKRNQLTLKYEPLQPFLFVSFLQHGQAEAVLDIGANIGVYSMMSSLVNSVQRIFAYEPDGDANKELKENIVLNGLGKRITTFQQVVSDKTGTVRFGAHAPMAGVNGVIDTSIHDQALFENIVEIQSIRLDDLEHLYGKSLGLKIDVEGHELNVINGAKQLLSLSPCIIQVEHYLGSEIDKVLGELGYFSFYNAGHDHYFTNIRNFASSEYVKQAVQYASACLIESQTKRWPKGKSIKDALQVSAQVENSKVKVKVVVDQRFFFDDLEYAFYLLEDGEKITILNYADTASAELSFDDRKQTVEVKAFVREKENPSKKIAVSYFVKRPPRGYQPESAVDSAYHTPSNSVAISKIVSRSSFDYPDTEMPCLTERCNRASGSNKLVQLGADSNSVTFVSSKNASVELYCTEFQKAILEKTEDFSKLRFKKLQVINCLDDIADIRFDQVTAFVLRAQFLSDINADWEDLSKLIEKLPTDCTLYTDGQVDTAYREAIRALCDKHGLSVEWLYPKSKIEPASFVKSADYIVPYPTFGEISPSALNEHFNSTNVEFIKQLLPETVDSLSGDSRLIEALGFDYVEESSVTLVDLRDLDADTEDFIESAKKRLTAFPQASTVLVLSERSADEFKFVVSQVDETLNAEIISEKHGVGLFRRG